MKLSYKINNPNKLRVNKNKCHVIPFGHRYTSAIATKFAGLRNFSLPFDWTYSLFPDKIKNVLQNDFEDYVPDVHNNIFHNKYDFRLAHFNDNIQKASMNMRGVLNDLKK